MSVRQHGMNRTRLSGLETQALTFYGFVLNKMLLPNNDITCFGSMEEAMLGPKKSNMTPSVTPGNAHLHLYKYGVHPNVKQTGDVKSSLSGDYSPCMY